METTNNNQPMLIDGLSCVCGYSKIYYSTVNVEDMSNINQLACPNCGIIMRSPPTDENGEWLKNHWKKTHGIVKTLTAERDEYNRRAEAAEHDIVARLGKCTCEARPGEGGEWVAAFGDLLTAAIVAPEPAERAEAIIERVCGLARLPRAGRTEAQG